jgi:AhpD family alkylhydroperoxidase
MKTTPTNPSAPIRILAIVATIGLFGAASAPALSDDGFMAIHRDNQKAGSAVANYWQGPFGTASTPAFTQDGFMAIHMDNQKIGSAVATYWAIQRTFGIVPSFFAGFSETEIAATWAEMKAVEFENKGALDSKTKELIGLAVAGQIPCAACAVLHKSRASANGATDAELTEAIAMAAITRRWSKVLNGMDVEAADFRKGVDDMRAIARHPAAD